MVEINTEGQFEIYVFTDRLIDVLPYNHKDPAWKKLLETPPPGKVILTDRDIEVYNWEDQEIILSSSSLERFWGFKLIEKSFIAYLDKKPLFGGSFIEPGSARAINYPVIYIDKSRSQVVFQLRPIHSIFESYRQLDMKIRRRIELPNVRRHFLRLGKLRSSHNYTPKDVKAIKLTELDSLPAAFHAAVGAATNYLKEKGEKPSEFYVSDISQTAETIVLPLWHISSFSIENRRVEGNPGGKCRSLEYDTVTKRITAELYWQ